MARNTSKVASIAAAREHLGAGEQRESFALAGGNFSQFRRAIEQDDADETGRGTNVAKFWASLGYTQGFDPKTITEISAPDREPITFKAVKMNHDAALASDVVEQPQTDYEIVEGAPFLAEPIEDPADGGSIDGLVDDMEAQAENFILKRGSLSDRIRDTLIDIYKHRPKPWSQLSSAEQKDVATSIEAAVKAVLRMAIVELAADDRPYIRAKLEKTANDGGKMKGTVSFYVPDDDTALAVHHATGAEIIMILADATQATTGVKQPPIETDEPELGFADDVPSEAGGDEDDEPPLDPADIREAGPGDPGFGDDDN